MLTSYWENEQPVLEKDVRFGKDGLYEPKISPVYSLVVQSEAIWLLAGLESGGITLQNIRPSEGEIIQYYEKHTSAVSVLKLDADERRALSGSWDRTIVEWDLETGRPAREFGGCSGQIGSLEWQPVGGALVQQNVLRRDQGGALFGDGAPINGGGGDVRGGGAGGVDDDEKSLDSLFGGDDDDEDNNGDEDLFGDGDDKEATKSGKAEANNNGESNDENGAPLAAESAPTTNQLSHSVFLSSCIDGTVDIWDRRQHSRVAHIGVSGGTPPWCMSVSLLFPSYFNPILLSLQC